MMINSVADLLRKKNEPINNPYRQHLTQPQMVQRTAADVNIPIATEPDKMIDTLRELGKPKKKEYVIGDSKEEIIENIINKKPSFANVRSALHKYADFIMDEDLF